MSYGQSFSSSSSAYEAAAEGEFLGGFDEGYGVGGAFADGSDAYTYSSNFVEEDDDALGQEDQYAASAAVADAGLSSSNFEQQSASSSAYGATAQGLYVDPNPQVIRRAAASGPQTYTQRVVVRFLQPPPVPPPGPLIIKEVRPPQPPPPPPLYIRQRPPPLPTLPPVVIRERPPRLPPAVPTQVITRVLPALPVPPRSVIIERLPPLPPKPRDVIVERWLPYQAQQKRRVIIQRAPTPVQQKPRNIIIYYAPPRAQVVRRFENLGVQLANPNEYLARYGNQLEDAQSLVTHARQAGVVEDISAPAPTATYGGNAFGGGVYGFSGGQAGAESAAYDEFDGLSLGGGYQSLSSYGGSAGGYGEEFGASFGGIGGYGGGSSSYESYLSAQF